LAYARADSVGLVSLREPDLLPILEFAPLQTLGDWAWVPGITWGHDRRTLFVVDHGAPLGLEEPAASPVFDLIALAGPEGLALPLARRTGMFAQPSVSPPVELPNGEIAYQVAYLQALSPLASEDSRYRLVVIDRDGSNRRVLFPAPGEPGLDPQQVTWSPDAGRLALIYQGDLWVVEVSTGVGHRLTGDGQASAIDWKP
jgi:hypothetical protein